MRRVLAATAVAVVCLVGSACMPTPPTITATPSTLKPACEQMTTVTGKANPVGSLTSVVLEYQKTGGDWGPWKWFETGADGETWHEIRKGIKSDGTYSLTYMPPMQQVKTIRLRIRAMKKLSETGVTSKSWYVNRLPC